MARVIIKFTDGQEKAGDFVLFNVSQPTFSLHVETEKGKTEVQNIRLDTVKMILFLRREEPGASQLRTETIDQSIYAGTLAFRLRVEFKDDDVIQGSTLKYNPNDKGFFLIPLNPADMSERIYVNAQATKNIDCKRLMGKILVDQKKITHEQLIESLKYQKEQREKKIGTILREKAIINEQQLQESLKQQRAKNKLLGEILLEAGYITSEQLDYALCVQKENRKKKLGQVLVELKYITPNDICIALATQFHRPWIDLSQMKIPETIVTTLPEEVEKKLGVIPIEKQDDNVLIVATSQPQDPDLAPVLSKFTPLKIELVVAYEGYIESALKSHYQSKE